MPLYFAYGSNLKRERLLERVTGALPAGIAWLADFAVVFDKRGADGTSKANLAPRFGARTWGALYTLSEEDFDRLDRFERGYARLFAEHVQQADRGCDFDFLSAVRSP